MNALLIIAAVCLIAALCIGLQRPPEPDPLLNSPYIVHWDFEGKPPLPFEGQWMDAKGSYSFKLNPSSLHEPTKMRVIFSEDSNNPAR